jgi:peptidoglycan/xylan/chitin deacetylase (PgdA/CDA1 family)
VLATPYALGCWFGVAGDARKGDDVIFTYHGTPRQRAAELERQLRYLRRQFRVVPLSALAASAFEQRPAGSVRQVALTFDDGLRNNITVAYPILRRLGVPATFFVCPGLIEEGSWLWTHDVRHRFDYAGGALMQELARELGAPGALEPFIEWMKTLRLSMRKRVQARLREATRGFVPKAADREASDLAGWEELRALDPATVTVGSHTMTHPILPTLSAAEIDVELRDSRRAIEAKLRAPAELFAYPNGSVDATVLASVRRHYRMAVSTHESGVLPGLDMHMLPRLPAPSGVLRLAWRLNRPVPHAEREQSRTGPTTLPLVG